MDWDNRQEERRHTLDGEYEVVDEGTPTTSQRPPERRSGWNRYGKSSAMGIGAMLLFLVTKGKSLLFALFSLLKFSKFFTSGISMFVMVWVYSLHYGWPYAFGIVLMIAIHEMGHLVFAKAVGMPVSLPFFIPFLGAMITMKEPPKDAWQEAVVAIGGPFFGLVAGMTAMYWGFVNQNGLVLAVAYFSFFITIFNMIPISPLDGGRIVGALSPWIWGIGVIVMALAAIYTMSPLMFLIVGLGGYRAYRTWQDRDSWQQTGYFTVTPIQRIIVGVAYVLISVLSGLGVYFFLE